MKKAIGSIILAVTLVTTFTGCNKKLTPEEIAAKEAAIEKANFRCRIDSQLAPEWACGNIDESIKDYITDVGTAPLSKLGQGFSRANAVAKARTNIALQINTLVKTNVDAFARSTGIGGAEVADQVSTQVADQVAKVTLKGSRQIRYWQNPSTKAITVLVGVRKDSLNQEVKNQVLSSYKNDNALWQQFQAKQALEALDKKFPTD